MRRKVIGCRSEMTRMVETVLRLASSGPLNQTCFMAGSRWALAARIEQARRAAGFETPAAAAIVLVLSLDTYRSHERGVYVPRPYDVHRYAEMFEVL